MAIPYVPNRLMRWIWFSRASKPKNTAGRREAFERMKSELVEGPVHCQEPLPDTHLSLSEKLDQLRLEFAGKPELAFHHAELVVRIRRGIQLRQSYDEFDFLWESEGKFLANELNSRWLLSALDTFADYGEKGEREAAMAAVAVINMLRFADSDHWLWRNSASSAEPPRNGVAEMPDRDIVATDKASAGSREKTVLWDGVELYNVTKGDALYNFMNRMNRCIEPYKTISLVYSEILKRAMKADTLVSRLMRLNTRFRLPT